MLSRFEWFSVHVGKAPPQISHPAAKLVVRVPQAELLIYSERMFGQTFFGEETNIIMKRDTAC